MREFLGESRENLDQIDGDLVALERNPDDTTPVARVFRAIHTIKGTCGFLGFSRLEAVSHAGEHVLSALRDEEIAATPALVSMLLATVDAIRGLLATIEATGEEGDADHGPLIEQLAGLLRGAPPPVPPPPPPSPTAPPPPHEAAAVEAPLADTMIRVDVALLDKLMNLVGELVLARNQIAKVTGASSDPTLLGATQQLNLITAELQEGVMKTRMQAIGNIWNKLPRVVRDLARACDKRVELLTEGESTELDKSLIEAIKDPLTHLVRNAIDHGIETPDRRIAAGKPALGVLRLRAFHQGGQVVIEIRDDGAGLDAERIRDKAIARGLLSAEVAGRMAERDLFRLVFLPGFSTAERVTNVSGRGVGMDVVRTNIEQIGGAIELHSQRGAGTTITIRIPLTLAIIPALIVACGDSHYAIPQSSLVELVRLDGDAARTEVELLFGTPLYRRRGQLLMLVELSAVLGGPATEPLQERAAIDIVVLQADQRQFGLVVDAVLDAEEIVVKPLGRHFKNTPVFAGATILGDGQIALILDVLGLAKRAGVVAESHERAPLEHAPVAATPPGAVDDEQTMLVFGGSDDDRMAILLSRVARLEEIPRSALERAGHELVSQYRGEIMPVLELSSLVGGARPPATDVLQVIVFSHDGAHVGLIVDRIIDIVRCSLAAPRPPSRPGVLGSVVIAGRVTELLDVEAALLHVQPGTRRALAVLAEVGHGA